MAYARMDRRSRRLSMAVLGTVLGLLLGGASMLVGGSAQAAVGWSPPLHVDPRFAIAPHSRQPISCASESFCVAVSSEGEVETFDGASWSAPTRIDDDALGAVSCPSASFCVALDTSNRALVFAGGSWGAPTTINHLGGGYETVSCSSSVFCVAFTGSQFELFNGSSWTEPKHVEFDYDNQVSCGSSTFCVAEGDNGQAVAFDGTQWGATFQIQPYARAQGAHVSCASASLCMAVRAKLRTYAIFNGSSWSEQQPVPVGSQYELEGVSCSSPTHCLVTAGNGRGGESVVYNGSTWSEPVATPSALGFDSCVSDTFCLAFEGVAGVAEFDGATWSARSLLGGSESGQISCASSDFCTLLDGNGRAATYTGGEWNVTDTNQSTAEIRALSCPSTSFCAAVGGTVTEPQALDLDGTAWSSIPAPAFTAFSVSCASASFCLATGGSDAAIDEGGGWGAPVTINGTTTEASTCPTSTFCVAVGTGGDVETFNGSAWSSPRNVDTGRTMTSVSCSSEAFCIAGDVSGYAVTLSEGATQASTREIAKREPIRGVSCGSPSSCVAITAGGVVTFDGSGWSKPTGIDTLLDGSMRSVSCPSASFCIVDTEGGDVIVGRPAPRVTGLSPASGPVTGGTIVTVTGTGLGEATAAYFGPNEATIDARSETSLTLEAPPGTGSVYVTVTGPGGTSPASGKEAKHAKFKYKKVKPAR